MKGIASQFVRTTGCETCSCPAPPPHPVIPTLGTAERRKGQVEDQGAKATLNFGGRGALQNGASDANSCVGGLAISVNRNMVRSMDPTSKVFLAHYDAHYKNGSLESLADLIVNIVP